MCNESRRIESPAAPLLAPSGVSSAAGTTSHALQPPSPPCRRVPIVVPVGASRHRVQARAAAERVWGDQELGSLMRVRRGRIICDAIKKGRWVPEVAPVSQVVVCAATASAQSVSRSHATASSLPLASLHPTPAPSGTANQIQ